MFCFDPSTQIKTKNGYKQIKNIQVEEELEPDCEVYARLLDTILKKHGIVSMGEVSGEHLVEYQDRFIKVMDHPESYEIEKTDDVICLTTSNGIIKTKITFLLIILILILVNCA